MKKKLFNIDPDRLADGLDTKNYRGNEIAVIGMAVDLPGGKGLDGLWSVVSEGKDCVRDLPANRKADVEQLMGSPLAPNRVAYQFGEAAYVDDLDCFDHTFFNIPYDEAVMINPMHRKLLQTTWQCMEDAGYTRSRIAKTRTGCFIGYSWNLNNYYDLVCAANPGLSSYAIVHNIASTLPGRISYFFDLHGPSMVVDTACSSSLVALHNACEQIAAGKMDTAFVGGVNLTFGVTESTDTGIGIESGSHRCLTFDEAADGAGRGEGTIMVLVKSLPLALKDGDNIYAVVKGWASNNDGGRSVGMAAPSIGAQEEVLLQAWHHAKINPGDIGFIEAHGTGTKIGDPIELEALTNAFRKHTKKRQFCAIGAVKANIGHLDTVAGIAGFVKSVLCLYHKAIPPQVNFEKPNSRISFLDSPVYVNDMLTGWHTTGNHKRLAGVNSFGISGTNVHIVLEEYEEEPVKMADNHKDAYYLFPVSAKTKPALLNLIAEYVAFFDRQQAEIPVAGLCTTAAIYRDHYKVRLGLVVNDTEALKQKLKEAWNKLQAGISLHSDEFFYHEHNRFSDSARQEPGRNIRVSGSEEEIKDAARHYVLSSEISWTTAIGKIPYRYRIPVYPFDKIRCWPDLHTQQPLPEENLPAAAASQIPVVNSHSKENNMNAAADISAILKKIVAESLDGNVELTDTGKTFFELGFDSINIVHIKTKFQKHFNIDIPVEELFSHLNTIDKLVEYVTREVKAVQPILPAQEAGQIRGHAIPPQEPVPLNGKLTAEKDLSDDLIGGLFARQLEIMELQINMLKSAGGNVTPKTAATEKGYIYPANNRTEPSSKRPASHYYSDSGSSFNDIQKRFIQELIRKVLARTGKSKAHTQQYRKEFASYRKAMYYDHYFKELIYPITAAGANGCKMTDLDGNVYVDFVMGFGVHLLGYNNPEVTDALLKQIQRGVFVGPMSPLAGEVAKLITEITGLERVAYANSGTEAVMHAIKISRAKTKRELVVKFSNSYHGFYDVVQADQSPHNPMDSVPNSLGIPGGITRDVLVLEFGKEASLDMIRDNIGRIACVLAEPVQSRRPEFQPKEFLEKLRIITQEAQVPLIFDEIITGFRIHPKGAMGFYDIVPDIVTYGKVLGGGMPMGAVCGKKEYLDFMDGGYWEYGDDSRPSENRIGTGGTFCHHPLAMASAKATLTIIKERGGELYRSLNEKTERLKNYLNNYFNANNIPIHIVNCGSLFSFKPLLDVKVMQVLYYSLLEKGIYLWQGATCFLSAAHTDADIETFIAAVIQGCEELIDNGFVSRNTPIGTIPRVPEEKYYDVSPSQGRLWFMHQLYGKLNAYNLATAYKLSIPLNIPAFQHAFEQVVRRHESLRTTFGDVDSVPKQFIHAFDAGIHGIQVDTTAHGQSGQEITRRMELEMEEVFDLNNGPLFKVVLYPASDDACYLFFNFHHLVADGFSIEIILKEIFILYHAATGNSSTPLKPLNIQYKDYAGWINRFLRSGESKIHRDYWVNRIGALSERVLIPPDFKRPEVLDFSGNSVLIEFTPEQSLKLYEMARRLDVTLFMIIVAVIKMLINKQAGDGNVVVGCPYSGRFSEELSNQIGFYVNTVVLADSITGNDTFSEVLSKVKHTVLEAGKHQIYPFDSLVRDLSPERHIARNQLFDIDVNMNDQDLGNYQQVQLGGSGVVPIDLKPNVSKFDMTFSIFKGAAVCVSLEYKTSLYEFSTIALMKTRMISIVEEILNNKLHVPIRQLNYDSGFIPESNNVFEKKELF